MKIIPKLVQILTGHGGFSQYLHRFKLKDNPACVCDPLREESVEHLVLECPKYDAKRFDVEVDMNYKLDKTIGTM